MIQNGRHAGTRRQLVAPVTLIGKSAECEIRLGVEGVAPKHCLVAQTPSGLVLRDLHSDAGTWLNGERVRSATVREGDLITIGTVEFCVQGLTEHRPQQVFQDENRGRDAWRVQVAAVAAQQAALDEQEEKLVQRQSALNEQEAQIAAHLDERRRELEALDERIRANSAARREEIARDAAEVDEERRALAIRHGDVEAERARLADLKARLRQRWADQSRRLRRERVELDEERRQLGEQAADLERTADSLEQRRLRFNAVYELGRRQLREAWLKLRREQRLWKQRRGRERAALKVRDRDLQHAERQLVHAQRLFLLDKKAWDARKQALHGELVGIDQRVVNLRQALNETAARRKALEAPSAGVTEHDGRTETKAAALSSPLDAIDAASDTASLALFRRLSDQLGDQRLELLDQWQQLALVYRQWESERRASAAELDAIAVRLREQAEAIARRKRELGLAAEGLQRQHDELAHLRHQMIAWRARLRVREHVLAGERARVISETRRREAIAEQQHRAIRELRVDWAERRQQEIDQLGRDRDEVEALRAEAHAARREALRRLAEVDDEKCLLAQKALAMEQHRQRALGKSGQRSAEHKLERLQRRCAAQAEQARRRLARERDALARDAAALERRNREVARRADDVARGEAELTRLQAAWDHQRMLVETRQSRLREELRHAEAQRQLFEHQCQETREEIERMARAIFSSPDQPALLEEAA